MSLFLIRSTLRGGWKVGLAIGAGIAVVDAVYAALQKALPSNLEALTMSSAQDSDAIVVTKATADKYQLTSIGDLAKPAN